MTGPSFPRFGDDAHLGHIELLTPKPQESLVYEWHTLSRRCRSPRPVLVESARVLVLESHDESP